MFVLRIAELFASYGSQKMILTPNPKNFKCLSAYLALPPPRAVQILHCAKQQMINASEFDDTVTDTVKRNFCVDDCLKSVGDDDKAISLASDLRELLAWVGFRLTKWVSNLTQVVASVPESERAGPLRISALINHLLNEYLVYCGILIYRDDPLGFVSPFVLPAKLLLQELCRKNLGWDDHIDVCHLCR